MSKKNLKYSGNDTVAIIITFMIYYFYIGISLSCRFITYTCKSCIILILCLIVTKGLAYIITWLKPVYSFIKLQRVTLKYNN